MHAKGAPEELLAALRPTIVGATAERAARRRRRAARARGARAATPRRGLRVLAVARRPLSPAGACRSDREDAERDLVLLGLVALFDPPRPEVADAVARCHAAGIRIIVITGDYGLTAAAIARRVGIAATAPPSSPARSSRRMSEPELDAAAAGAATSSIFARSSPEAKLRIADALRAEGHVVAMTGDGVNDAPALRRADIGVAMGAIGHRRRARGGDDGAHRRQLRHRSSPRSRQGRRVYDNVRKFILYIFAHATPEVVPFLVFALSGGAMPLPLTVLQILAIDLGTETLPALALGREPAEPGTDGPPAPPAAPRESSAGDAAPGLALPRPDRGRARARRVLLRAPARAGWSPGDDVGAGTPLHDAYLQATTMTFAGHRRLPDRHRLRRPHRARLAALDRRLHQPAAALGHRLRARVRRRDHLRAAAAGRSSAPPRSVPPNWRCSPFPVHRLGL